jgi:hypothetical protein
VDVLIDPSRFLSELPDEVRELSVIAAENEDEQDLLESGGRYQLPGFIDDTDDIN